MVEIVPLPEACGAEVRCGDVAALGEDDFRAVYAAWLEHLVLVFHGQELPDAALLAFARRFGPVKAAATGDVVAEVHVVSNVAPGGLQGNGDVPWHSDMAGFRTPPSASFLYALEVPAEGGDTFFLNLYRAWETLPDALRERAPGLSLKHAVRPGTAGDAGDGAVHPLVWTHPETGANALFLGARGNTSVAGLAAAESEALLDALWKHAIRWDLIARHRWRPGDLVVWDNRCLLHAREGFDASARRVLHRTQVEGTDAPRVAPDARSRPPHPRRRP